MIEQLSTEELVEAWECSEEDIHICADGSVNFGRKNILSPMGAQELEEEDKLASFLESKMQQEGFWPNIWSHNDHGNVELLAIQDGRFIELGGLV